jgi:hypothetical protein
MGITPTSLQISKPATHELIAPDSRFLLPKADTLLLAWQFIVIRT